MPNHRMDYFENKNVERGVLSVLEFSSAEFSDKMDLKRRKLFEVKKRS